MNSEEIEGMRRLLSKGDLSGENGLSIIEKLFDLLLEKEKQLTFASQRFEALKKEIAKSKVKSSRALNRHIVDVKDLALILGRSEKSIRRLESERVISSKRIPRGEQDVLMFDLAEVLCDIDRYTRKSILVE